jgi:type IV pilus assembly protein PilC
MKKLAERYREEIDARIDGLLSMLEPSLVAVFSVIVGMILISVMLPLMGIMSSIG